MKLNINSDQATRRTTCAIELTVRDLAIMAIVNAAAYAALVWVIVRINGG